MERAFLRRQYIPGENRGKVKFDGAFDLFDADSQAAVLDACARLEDWTCNEDGCQFGKLVRAGEVRCFLSEFNAWHLNEYGTAAADVADSATYVARLTTFRENDTPDNFPLLTWEKDIGIINGELKYVQIGAKMTMKLLQAVRIKDPIEARAEAFVKSIDTPKTAKTVFQYSFDWTWSATQTGMISGMTTGMSIAFPLALVVLTVATMNWLIALLAIISVGSIVAAVLGVCECFLGWSLGTGEAIAGVMVIGLAVDYTIHLGAPSSSHRTTRRTEPPTPNSAPKNLPTHPHPNRRFARRPRVARRGDSGFALTSDLPFAAGAAMHTRRPHVCGRGPRDGVHDAPGALRVLRREDGRHRRRGRSHDGRRRLLDVPLHELVLPEDGDPDLRHGLLLAHLLALLVHAGALPTRPRGRLRPAQKEAGPRDRCHGG